ncbi:MAG: VWA domain-containing protein [Thermoanaerobaculia bacterium]
MRGKAGWLIAAMVLGRIALGAQQATSPPLGAFSAAIDVRVVNVEAVVTDRKGQLVKGLKAADFRLQVDGRDVPIDYFSEVFAGAGVATPAVAASSQPPKAPVRAGTSYLFFIDEWFSNPIELNNLLSRIERELRLEPEDRAAIVTFDGRPTVLSGWTSDVDSVRKILEQVRLHAVQPPAAIWFADAEPVTAASAAAAQAMRGLPPPPGRKVFLLISNGWPEIATHSEVLGSELPSGSTEVPLEKLFEPVADSANLLGYTLYFLEVPGAMSFKGRPSPVWSSGRPTGRSDLVFLDDLGQYQNLWKLAERTGGQAVAYSSSLSAFDQVAKDTRSYYSMGFTPEWRADGTRHRILLKVRSPGLGVRTRDGFFDMSPRLQASLRTESLLLFGQSTLKVVAGPPTRTGSERLEQTIELPVILEIPAGVLRPWPVGAGYELRAKLATDSMDEWGGTSRTQDVPIRINLASQPVSGSATLFKVTLKLRNLKQRLVFAVEDERSPGQARGELDWQPPG